MDHMIIGNKTTNIGMYNTIFGSESDIDKGSNNVIIGAKNLVNGDNNLIMGNNNNIIGSNNVIFGNGLSITGDDHYIVMSTHIHKNIDLMFDRDLIYKLLIFDTGVSMILPKDIVRHICNIIYDIRLSKGEAMSYCSKTIQNAFSNYRLR